MYKDAKLRILITGVAGHVGSKLAEWILREQTAEIIGIDDLSCGYRDNVPRCVEFIESTADDLSVINNYGPFDLVYHFAAYAAECMSPFVRRFNYSNNLVQTAGLVSNLIDANFQGRLVFASSIAVYGAIRSPFDENMHCCPHDPYGVAKLACERDIRIAGQQHNLDYCILRPHNIYGPGQSLWQQYRNVLGLWMRAVLEGWNPIIFGSGEQKRAFTYIEDILPCLWNAGVYDEPQGRTINIGGSQPVTINELATAFTEAIEQHVTFDYQPCRHEVKNAWCTTRASEEYLQYRDLTKLTTGIREMWKWAKIVWSMYPERREQPPMELETDKGLPDAWKMTVRA